MAQSTTCDAAHAVPLYNALVNSTDVRSFPTFWKVSPPQYMVNFLWPNADLSRGLHTVCTYILLRLLCKTDRCVSGLNFCNRFNNVTLHRNIINWQQSAYITTEWHITLFHLFCWHENQCNILVYMLHI